MEGIAKTRLALDLQPSTWQLPDEILTHSAAPSEAITRPEFPVFLSR